MIHRRDASYAALLVALRKPGRRLVFWMGVHELRVPAQIPPASFDDPSAWAPAWWPR